MSLYNQLWEEADYIPRQHVHLQTLARNAYEKVKTLKWDFVQYKTQQDLPCLLYERLFTHCANHYGLLKAIEHKECKTILNFFNNCVQQHTFHGYMKKYNPEFYATYDASRSKVNFNDLVHNHTL